MLKLSDFDYLLPKALIAQYPLKERDNARLLILDRKKGSIEHRIFKDITEYLKKEDLLVLNNTKVKACRIKARRLTGGKLELLLVKQKRGLVFEALIKPGRVRIGEEIIFNGGQASARISARNEVTFNLKDRNEVYKLGAMPLPPYIKREPEAIDNLYYQTVYALDRIHPEHRSFGVEGVGDVLARVTGLVRELEYTHIARTIVLVTHADVGEILQTAFMGLQPQEHRNLPKLRNAEPRELRFMYA